MSVGVWMIEEEMGKRIECKIKKGNKMKVESKGCREHKQRRAFVGLFLLS